MTMTPDLRRLIDQQGDAWQAFKARHEGELEELNKEVGSLHTELRRYGSVAGRLDQLEAALRRGGGPGNPVLPPGESSEPERKAFAAFLRRGAEALEPNERKALIVGSDPAGGYLASSTFERELLRNLVEVSPLRRACRVTPGGGTQLVLPRRTSALSAGWVSEIAAAPESQPAFGQVSIEAYRLAAYCEVSNVMLEDSDVDLEAELQAEFVEQFAVAEGTAFAIGSGVDRPRGILTYPAGTGDGQVEQIPLGHASALTADGLVTMLYSLKARYRANASWIMNSSTFAAVRKLKDGAGRYLWDAGNGGLVNAAADTLLGRPVLEVGDMPAIAPNALPVAVGDFRAGYRVFDRRGLQVLRDPYTRGRNGLTVFIAGLRVGGGVVLPEAVKLGKVATS